MRPDAEAPLSLGLAGRSRAWRAGLRLLLGDDALVVREATNAGEALAAAGSCDVLILDDELAGALDGEDLAGPTVVLSDDPSRLALRSQEAGFALLPADATPAQLRAAILAAAAGLVAVPLEAATTLLVEAAEGPAHPPPDEPLSPRETDVLRLLAEGWSNKRIARALAISDNTVKYHLAAVYGKLGVSSRAGAVRRGLEAGLLKV